MGDGFECDVPEGDCDGRCDDCVHVPEGDMDDDEE